MLIPNNLRTYRKRARLIQEDIGFILALSDNANVSRMENGLRKPSFEILLIYHLLFEMPIETLFQEISDDIKRTVVERIQLRIEELKALPAHIKIANRIAFFEVVLTRLTPPQTL